MNLSKIRIYMIDNLKKTDNSVTITFGVRYLSYVVTNSI